MENEMTDASSRPPDLENVASGKTEFTAVTNETSPHAVALLRRTRPWALFLFVITIACGGLMAIVMISVLFGASSMFGESNGDLTFRVCSSIVQIGFCLYASFLIFRYFRAVGTLVETKGSEALERVLDAQRKIWKLVGIAIAILIAQAVFYFLAAVAFGVQAQHATVDNAEEETP